MPYLMHNRLYSLDTIDTAGADSVWILGYSGRDGSLVFTEVG